MRDHEAIDSELRRIASERRSTSERGADWKRLDELLDERLGHRTEAPELDTHPETLRRLTGITGTLKPRRRRSVLHVGMRAALPLSLLAAALAVVAMVVALRSNHYPDPVTQAADAPPSGAPSRPEPPNPVAPKALAPLSDIVDTAYISTLKHDGVPIPSREYVLNQGHAVCDSLGRHATFTETVHSVQQATIWDGDQSAAVAAGAIVSYCPQYQAASSDDMQQTYRNALSDLQRIQGDLQGIRDRLQSIPGRQ